MEFGVVFWVSLIAQSLVCAGFCHKLAYEKGYLHRRLIDQLDEGEVENAEELQFKTGSHYDWAIIGFFFGLFALIAAAGLPDRKTEVTWWMNKLGKQ